MIPRERDVLGNGSILIQWIPDSPVVNDVDIEEMRLCMLQ